MRPTRTALYLVPIINMPSDLYDDMRTLNMLYEELCWDHEDELDFVADYVNDRIIITNNKKTKYIQHDGTKD